MFKLLKLTLIFIFLLGIFFTGMITQKYYGLGNLLAVLDSDYVSPERKEWVQEDHRGNLDIFILAGQSNMEGDGELSPHIHFDNLNRIYLFDEQYKWKPAHGILKSKFGPSISFASTILETHKNTTAVGIVNVARGGTGLKEWTKNYADNSLYQTTIKRALAASTQGQIKGLLFFQGEKDADRDSTGHYQDWHIVFEDFVEDIRNDLGLEQLPVVYAQIGKGDHPLWNEVKNSQKKVRVPFSGMIQVDDLDYREGSIHFNSEGYIEIGKRFGHKWLELSNTNVAL